MIRAYHAAAGTLAMLGLVWWLMHVPDFSYSAWMALGVLLPLAALLLWRRDAWLIVMPALWPIVDLVPATGRMYLAESDALALLCIAVLSWHAALSGAKAQAGSTEGRAWRGSLLLGGIALSFVVSAVYALTPWPVLDENAFANYTSPFNALRLSKSIVWALLLLPHWLALRRQASVNADRILRIGMTLGLATASLAALWDRVAFNALLDFASDYRTTGLFWEMHVGGAALDGWLMLTLPFAVAGLLHARKPLSLCLHLSALTLAAYAILTIFSRGVYLGCVAMLLCALPFWWRQRAAVRARPGRAREDDNSWRGPLMLMACGVVALPVFHGGGYRGLGAMCAAGVAVYVAGGLLRPMRVSAWLPVLCIAAVLTSISFLLHDQFWKAAYGLFALACFCAALCALVVWRKPGPAARRLLAISAAWCLAGPGWICWHWGGGEALSAGLVASALLGGLLLAQTMAAQPLWKIERQAALATGMAAVVMAMVAVGAGSYFIGTRFSTTGEDLGGRVLHWKHGIALIQDASEWAFGIGVGRYAERYYWQAPIDELPGVWRIANDDGNRMLHLVGPRFPMGANQLLRVSQRIGVDLRGPFAFRLRARAPQPVSLKVEVCQKHLLYAADCASAAFVAVPGGNAWTQIRQAMSDKPLATGHWYAPRMTSFAIAIRDQGKFVEVDDIEVIDAAGNSLLGNGDFSRGAENWFFSSDRVHLPYHAKSVAIHLLVEQGLFGLLAVGLACAVALVRLAVGRARSHPSAPVLLAALVGFLTVGVFDSLLDVPRVAAFFFLLLGVALCMRRDANR